MKDEWVEHEPRWVDTAISVLLRGGVFLSTAVVILGVVLTFVHHPQYVSDRTALTELVDPAGSYPHNVREVLSGARGRHGQSIVMIGLLLLVATPVARVAFSIVVFLIERDGMYAAMTAVVLFLLLLSLFLGIAG